MIVGAGVVGIATAYVLARRGCRVTIIDRRDGPGEGTSFANGAQLSYVYTDALANAGLLRRMPGLLLGADPAFRMKLNFDPAEARWLLRFLGQCSSSAFERNTLAGLALGLESRAAMHDLLARHPLDFAHAVPGKLHIHDSASTFAAAQALAEIKKRLGAEQIGLAPAEAVAIEPAIAGREASMAGAIYSPQEEVGDPHRFCIALTDVLVRDYQVEPWFGVSATSIVSRDSDVRLGLAGGHEIVADHIMFCTGTVPKLAPLNALASRVMGMKGYSFTAPPGSSPPRVSITDVSRKIVFCRLGDAIRVAGLAQLGVRDPAIDPKAIHQLLEAASAALPEAAAFSAAGNYWAGHRPMTVDSLPIIERIAPAISVNLGHGMLGWTYAMGSAERAAAMIGDIVHA